jgi:hypothetical protein
MINLKNMIMDTETSKVIIENWPINPWYKEWIPIFIALIALITSFISLYWTRHEFIKNSRPYVWASNYGVIDAEKKTILPIPFRIGFRVKNTPARIISLNVEIVYKSQKLFTYTLNNIVRFPDESSEWTFTIGKDDFDKIMSRPDTEKSSLTRMIMIKYSALDGGKIYGYELQQVYEPSDNQWRDTFEEAN